MPNMSRRSLHRYDASYTYDKETNTEENNKHYVDSTYLSKVERIQPRSLFLNNNQEKYYSTSSQTAIRRIYTFVTSIFISTLTLITSVFTTFTSVSRNTYARQDSALIQIGRKIHLLATRIMLWDTWLLQSTKSKRKLSLLLALCLLPLLLFGGWWLLSTLGPLLVSPLSARPTENTVYVQSYPELTAEQLQQIAAFVQSNADRKVEDVDVLVAKILPLLQHQQKGNEDDDIRFKEQQIVIDNLRKEVERIREEMRFLEAGHSGDFAGILAQLRAENAEAAARLSYQLKRCCRYSLIQMESYIARILKDLLGAPAHLTSSKDISNWIHSTFVAKENLESHLGNLTQHLRSDFQLLLEENEKIIMDKVMLRISEELSKRLASLSQPGGDMSLDALSDAHIKRIVHGALTLYDADKTGLVDYALESAGGQVVSTRCTETYQAKTAVLSVFGIPLWYPTNTPRTVINSGMTPGECWAFQNFPGFLLVKLSAPIKIEAFSLEHISKLLVPNGRIDSAPKDFSVYGLRNETDKDPLLLGKYNYDFEGPSLQYFATENEDVFELIELRVHSNHGNPNYTCLYRFRVHGQLRV